MSFQFFHPAKTVTITHGDLPHWEQEDATYFITWRTLDSIPRPIWERWIRERNDWLRRFGIDPNPPDWKWHVESLPDEQRKDFRRFSKALEDHLDACHGECLLRRPDLAQIVADSLRFLEGQKYTLGDFVIMPNHVHLLVGGLKRGAMLSQVKSWKKWTALKINESTGRQGRFWQDESFDHLVRNQSSHEKLRQYIAENPAKAALKPGEYIHWQSAA